MKGFALPSYTFFDADRSSSPFLSRLVQPPNITPGVQTAIHCKDLPSSSIHVGYLLHCPVHNPRTVAYYTYSAGIDAINQISSIEF